MTLEIRQHAPGKKLKDFIRVPHIVLAGDPHWIPPLDLMMSDTLTPSKNPFFQHAEATLFTAYRRGKPVGRISAQIDREHLHRYRDDSGFFGFFDTIDDEEVGKALMGAAERWVRERGMKRILGPMSLSINEEVGTLVDGFDSPNVLYMAHHAPHQDRIARSTGLTKAKDLFAFRWEMGSLPQRAYRAHAHVAAYPEVRLRSIDFKRDIMQLIAIQDDAWRHNWGHVSMTEAEANKLVEDLSLLIDPAIAIVAEIDGELSAMALAVPNLNEAIHDLRGKLLPLGLFKLLYRLKVRKLKSGRMVFLGVKEKYRKQKRYGAIPMAMVAEVAERGRKAGYTWGELGWTLEDNTPVNLLVRASGGKQYKTYRVYEKSLLDPTL